MNEKWEYLSDVDSTRRLPQDWAKIYYIKPLSQLPQDRLWSEYEWAYNFVNVQYIPLNFNKTEKTSEMELRATLLRRDLFIGADESEKNILENQYIETLWAKRMLKCL